MKQGTIKLDTKNVLFCTCIFVYLLSLLNMCIDYVNVVCLKMCSHYRLGLLLVSAVLYHMSSHKLYSILCTYLISQATLSFMYSGKSLTNSGHAKDISRTHKGDNVLCVLPIKQIGLPKPYTPG